MSWLRVLSAHTPAPTKKAGSAHFMCLPHFEFLSAVKSNDVVEEKIHLPLTEITSLKLKKWKEKDTVLLHSRLVSKLVKLFFIHFRCVKKRSGLALLLTSFLRA